MEERLLYFLIIPAIGYGISAIWLRRTMHGIAERQVEFLRDPGVTSKFLLFLVLPSTTVLFGLVVFVLLQDTAPDPVSNRVVQSLGLTFSLAALLTALSETWLISRRGAMAFEGGTFARVLVLAVLPEGVIVYTVMIALSVLGFVIRGPTEPPLSATEADGLIRACQYMAVGCLGAPAAAFLANRVPTLEGKSFVRALALASGGTSLTILALVLAFQEIARL
jgi:F0F1-type ATP synthase membrane subunit c/vacuolar-type H+-ATPase subunit K